MTCPLTFMAAAPRPSPPPRGPGAFTMLATKLAHVVATAFLECYRVGSRHRFHEVKSCPLTFMAPRGEVKSCAVRKKFDPK